MNTELLDFLSNFPILTEAERELIAGNSTVKEFKKGSYLLREGEVADQCFMILRGCVREFFHKDGEEKSIGFYMEGDPVNSFTSASTKTPSKSNFVCTEDSLLTISTDALEEQMCKLIPRLSSIIQLEVEKNTGMAHDNIAKLLTSSPEERYLSLIKNKPDLLNRIPQHQIASYIGVKPESLSRIRKRIVGKD